MIDTVLALFILWILVFIVGLIRRGMVWAFLDIFLIFVMYYEGASIVLTISLIFITAFSILYMLRGEEEWET